MMTSSRSSGHQALPGRPSSGHMNPYLAGAGLGLTVLAAFLVLGHGLGASGAFATLTSAAVDVVAPGHAADNGVYAAYLGPASRSPLAQWLVLQIAGVFLGGFVSARRAGRLAVGVVKGRRVGLRGRLVLAFSGGLLMGFAAMLARGCTSGQALSGGALLSVGGWVFMLAVFLAGYVAAPLFRRSWL